jgi:hypothetical protein
MIRRFALAIVVSGGCSWLFLPHLPADYEVGKRKPQCVTSRALPVVDTVLAVADFALAAAVAKGGSGTGQDSLLIADGILEGLLYTGSAVIGYHWASECQDANEAWAQYRKENPTPPVQPIAATPPPTMLERATVGGARQSHCTTQLDNPDVGACFFDEDACVAERDKLGDSMGPCAPRDAVSCFDAIGVLDRKRVSVCAPSIKDCEARREKLFADPDFTSVSEQCTIYRVEK